MLSRDDRSDNDLTGGGMDELGLESLGGTFGRGLDERTEIILAATFLVLIILAFIRLVVLVVLLCIYAYLSLSHLWQLGQLYFFGLCDYSTWGDLFLPFCQKYLKIDNYML